MSTNKTRVDKITDIGQLLTSSDDLNTFTNAEWAPFKTYYWTNGSCPTNAPVAATAAVMIQVAALANRSTQVVYLRDTSRSFVRSYNGTTWTAWRESNAAPTVQYFTSPGTWTRPDGCRAIKVTVVAGGGRGGPTFTSPVPANHAGNSGASGGGAIKTFPDVTPPAYATAPVTVGAGGSPTPSTSGGPSNFGSAPQGPVSATGGGAGPTAGSTPAPGGSGSGGDLNITGAGGNISEPGLAPGASSVGAAASAPTYLQYGGGGRGQNPAPGPGSGVQNGQAGIVIVEEFY